MSATVTNKCEHQHYVKSAPATPATTPTKDRSNDDDRKNNGSTATLNRRRDRPAVFVAITCHDDHHHPQPFAISQQHFVMFCCFSVLVVYTYIYIYIYIYIYRYIDIDRWYIYSIQSYCSMLLRVPSAVPDAPLRTSGEPRHLLWLGLGGFAGYSSFSYEAYRRT